MATKTVNAKPQAVAARVPHEVMNNAEVAKMPGESTEQFVTTALRREVKYRQRRKAKEPE